jgi:hypothetical protein
VGNCYSNIFLKRKKEKIRRKEELQESRMKG